MNIAWELYACRQGPDNVDATSVYDVVLRDKPWTNVEFRAANGITELYATFVKYKLRNLREVEIYQMFHEIASSYHNHVAYNFEIQENLVRMVLTLKDAVDKGMLNVVRGTLAKTIVPFYLFVHKYMHDDDIAIIHEVLVNVVFPHDKDILSQWSEVGTDTQMNASVEKTCPITLDTIKDGAIASDGHLYERCAILRHMVEHAVSPMTREYLDTDVVKWNPDTRDE